MKKASITFIVLPFLFISSCKNVPIKPGEVKAKWSRNLHQLGIVPVFPPREDIYVGDVYSFETNPDAGKYLEQLFKDYEELSQEEQIELISLGMGSRLARLPLNELISEEYENTISIPQTSNDYNSILGNPSVAAVEDSINEQKSKITEVENTIAALNKENNDAAERLKTATRAKEDADSEVTRLAAELSAAKAKNPIPGDSSQIDIQLSQAKADKRQKEDELAEIKHKIILSEPDSEEHKSLKRKEAIATYEVSKLTTQISRLEEDKRAIPSTPVDYSNEQALYDAAIQKQLADQKELTEATRHNTDTIEKNTPEIAEQTAKLTKEKEKLTELNELKKAIVSAGAKSLYKQPDTAQKNLFSWVDINATEDASRVNRLKLVAFPEFASTMVSQKDLSALIPAEALALNISSSAVDTVSIKIPSAESYGISFFNLADILFKIDNSSKLTINQDFESLVQAARVRASLFKEGEIKPTDKVYLRIITEVFYARAFDISLFSNDSFGALIDYAKFPEKQAEDEEEQENADYSQFTGVINSSAAGDSNDLLSQLRSNLSRTQNVPGGTIQMLNYSDSSIGLRRVFDRPIAVGFRGITLEFYPCYAKDSYGDCLTKIGKLTTATSPVPTVVPR